MSDRYFVESPIRGEQATLAGAEAHHLAHVMRAKPGHEVVLFDGSGAQFTARVEKVTRSTVDLSVLARSEVDRELPFALTLGVALPKGDRQRWLVEKAVELGVTRLAPLSTARAVAEASSAALTRLRRAVIEASKQCGRNRLMEIADPRTAMAYFAGALDGSLRLLADPSGATVREVLANIDAPNQGVREVLLAIGPEGGFTSQELEHATQSGWKPVALGPRILRVETAALLLAGLATTYLVPDRR